MTGLDSVLAAIDAANAADPNTRGRRPAGGAGLRRADVSDELARRFPDASEHLRIAARGQHVERWKIAARPTIPDGRAGYLAWRTDQARAHAERVTGFMADAGYGAEDRDRVARLLRKEGIKRNPEMQMLEDVICFVFLRWYFADFTVKHADEDIGRIRRAHRPEDVARGAGGGAGGVRPAGAARACLRRLRRGDAADGANFSTPSSSGAGLPGSASATR